MARAIALLLLVVSFAWADDLEREVALMAKVGFSASPTFSPDGERVAFVSNISGLPQVWIAPTGSGWPAKVTAVEDPVGSVSWSPAGDLLALSLAPGGGMNQQVYLVESSGRELRRITAGGKHNNFLGEWSHDGKLLALSSNRRNAASVDAYLYDTRAGRLRLAVRNPGLGFITDISRDGKYVVVSRMKSRGDNNLFLVERKSRDETLLTPHEPPGTFDGGRFSPDGSTVYLASNKDRDLVAFAAVRIDDLTMEPIAKREDGELQEFEISRDGTVAALVWNVAGRSELQMFDLRTRKPIATPALPAELAGDLEFSHDGRLLAMTLSGSTAPRDVWLMDTETRQFRQLTRSPHAGVDLTKLVRPELERFRGHDGVDLTGWLYRAPGKRSRAPLVLSFHGGPESQERPRFRADYQALLQRGISVFAPNVRGSSGFGKRFVNLDNGPLRENAVRDIRACLDHVIRTGVADRQRIGIMGGSYGGYMVMAGLAEYPDSFAAGVNLFGVVNFKTFFDNTEPWMAAISTVEYGDPETQGDMLRALSPIHKIQRVNAPTLVLHGANDTNVPVVEAEQVVENLKERGVPVEYVLFPDEGHGFRKTANRIRSTVAIVRWFDRYLN